MSTGLLKSLRLKQIQRIAEQVTLASQKGIKPVHIFAPLLAAAGTLGARRLLEGEGDLQDDIPEMDLNAILDKYLSKTGMAAPSVEPILGGRGGMMGKMMLPMMAMSFLPMLMGGGGGGPAPSQPQPQPQQRPPQVQAPVIPQPARNIRLPALGTIGSEDNTRTASLRSQVLRFGR